jgi:sodium transport system permease protein
VRALFIVFAKEFLENLRDRRTLLSALLFGPLFGPLMFGLIISRTLEQSVLESDIPLKLTISGSHHAPGLTGYLESRGAKLTKRELSENEARAAVRGGKSSCWCLRNIQDCSRRPSRRRCCCLPTARIRRRGNSRIAPETCWGFTPALSHNCDWRSGA